MPKNAIALTGVLLAVAFIYGAHLRNDFHFDDSHTIVQNPYIRDIHNLPRFFVDPDISSVLPANRAWRPIVYASLLIDYWLGSGYNPFWFHICTLVWFLTQVLVVFWLARAVFEKISPGLQNDWPAVMSAALFGLHPVAAETVNYIIQRAEIQSTLGVTAALLLYIWLPGLRRFGFYLLPFIVGVLAKPPALVFPFLLFLYIWLVEEQLPRVALKRCVPALLTAAVLATLTSHMVSGTFTPGAGSATDYRITQPLVMLRYFWKFFVPAGLSADTDHAPLTSIFDEGAIAGFIFLCVLVWAIYASAKRRMKPAAFGLTWFVVTLIPTSLMPLAEVENDHRMYFAFVGLTIAVPWAVAHWLRRYRIRPVIVATGCGLVLAVFSIGAWERCEVWKTEETLWRNTVLASPHNGRALMNYGLTLMSKGDSAEALSLFQRASFYLPNYYVLEINLGIVNGALKNNSEAEKHFLRAIELAPAEASPKYYYARWLHETGRYPQASQILKAAVTANPSFVDSWYLLMQNAADAGNPDEVTASARQMLAQFPSDATARGWLSRASTIHPSPEAYLNQSLALYRAGRFQDCIAAARKALELRPDYADAWNNIAASYNALSMWDEGIQAATKAVQLQPNSQLARNNLAWAVRNRPSK